MLPLSIIIADLNGLKLVNDAFGHDMGDKLLKKAASIIKKSCRSEDIIARWGGDEFSIVLNSTGERQTGPGRMGGSKEAYRDWLPYCQYFNTAVSYS
jgi:diguanylate cyclase (GGDEF)-like protein